MLAIVLSYLYPVVGISFLGVVGKFLLDLLPKVVSLVVSKTGIAKYDLLKKDAVDIWNILEENHRLNELADSKIVLFSNMLKAKYPLITDERIEQLNKALAGEFNKDKPIAIEELNPAEIVPTVAQIKYVDVEGTEYVKKVIPVTAV
ncbi:hypothetical protein K2F43_06185 [Clostridium estertheticum]|uniref:hypothetical protein n=1 Tax=Clostridium estertheticum TaxID=238834 RepID=UPI001C6E8B30|nr:hypothetical protein [Clostridium estertheticum]MBW9170795.1 hypothetical protein [Clostridium estertheticum]WLC74366.1 hypothetical protein KTC99_16570 [Clostridium estertheticum]